MNEKLLDRELSFQLHDLCFVTGCIHHIWSCSLGSIVLFRKQLCSTHDILLRLGICLDISFLLLLSLLKPSSNCIYYGISFIDLDHSCSNFSKPDFILNAQLDVSLLAFIPYILICKVLLSHCLLLCIQHMPIWILRYNPRNMGMHPFFVYPRNCVWSLGSLLE